MSFSLDLVNSYLLSQSKLILPKWFARYEINGDIFEDAAWWIDLKTGKWGERNGDGSLTKPTGDGLVHLYAMGKMKTPEWAHDALSTIYKFEIEEFAAQTVDKAVETVKEKRPRKVKAEVLPAEGNGSKFVALKMNKQEDPFNSLENVNLLLKQDGWRDGLEIWFDDFYQRVFTSTNGSAPREWSDVDDVDLTIKIQSTTRMQNISESIVSRAVLSYANGNRRNEPRDWLNSLVWDGDSRIENLLSNGFGALPSDYTMDASRNFMISMVARILQPGCKVDNMLVLEGKQGKHKSTALEVLGQPWFMESTETIGSIDFLQSLQGKMLVEIAELDSFSRADARTVKKTVTCRIDRYRGSYARHSKDYPRQCVFVGTTNEDEYLEDPTGGRRFWPIRVTKVNLDWIRSSREQLFSEAVIMFKNGETWWEMPDQAADEQAQRRRKDAWEDRVAAWINNLDLKANDTFTLQQVAHMAIGIEAAKLSNGDQQRVGKVLKALGADKRHTKIGNMWTLKAVEMGQEEPGPDFPALADGEGVGPRDNVAQFKKRIKDE